MSWCSRCLSLRPLSPLSGKLDHNRLLQRERRQRHEKTQQYMNGNTGVLLQPMKNQEAGHRTALLPLTNHRWMHAYGRSETGLCDMVSDTPPSQGIRDDNMYI